LKIKELAATLKLSIVRLSPVPSKQECKLTAFEVFCFGLENTQKARNN
jgi:hypothetical protein